MYNRLSVLQIDNFTLLEETIIAEGGSETLMKFNQEKKKINNGRMQREEGKGI